MPRASSARFFCEVSTSINKSQNVFSVYIVSTEKFGQKVKDGYLNDSKCFLANVFFRTLLALGGFSL